MKSIKPGRGPSLMNDMFENRFCPYCGAPVAMDFEYCNNCGRKLPR